MQQMSFNNINLAASMGYNGYLKLSQQSLLYSHSVTLPEMQKLKPVQRLITLILLVGKHNVSQKKS